MDQQIHTLHVKGIHCASCVILIEDTVRELEGVSNVWVSLKRATVEIVCRNDEMSPEKLSELINPLIASYGYTLHLAPATKTVNWWEYVIACIMAAALIYGFVTLQKLWLLQMLNADHRTYGTSFVIGLIASISSCLAVVWAVVLALGTVYANSSSYRPQWLFHVGRLVGFFLLWGLLWLIWSTFQISQNASIILNMIIALVLFVLWLNLLGIVKGGVTWWWGGIFKRFTGMGNEIFGPLLIGIGTFFLPCGFTQSMQIYTLSTGSFLSGGLTMLSFALWTLPVLGLLSMTWKRIQTSASSWLFFKTIGIILLVVSLYNFMSSLVALGAIPPFFTL